MIWEGLGRFLSTIFDMRDIHLRDAGLSWLIYDKESGFECVCSCSSCSFSLLVLGPIVLGFLVPKALFLNKESEEFNRYLEHCDSIGRVL